MASRRSVIAGVRTSSSTGEGGLTARRGPRSRSFAVSQGDIPGRERFLENQAGRLFMLIGLA